MKLSRVLAAVALVLILCGVAYVSQANEPAGAKMVSAAEQFLASLSPELKARATFAFDDPERFRWHFVPLQDGKKPARKGVRMEEMNEQQQAAAKELIRAGTSASGFTKATTIMSLEAILNELEAGRGPVRNPGWYFFTVYGTPSRTGRWGWRVDGHHLALNFTVDGGKVVSATPAFFGANPAIVRDGPRKGTRALPEADDLARELYRSLDDEQRKVAHQGKQFPEVQGQTRLPDVGEAKGLPGAKLDAKQRELLLKLIEAYANRMSPDIAQAQLAEVRQAGVDAIHFAYAGGLENGQPHSYRVQGPAFVIEFLNVQADSAKNPANHIHSSWRSLKGDFGLTN